ncbi:ABC transporter permease [uncultured Arsenicicoccus sp.]|uniref:ABC transporter permease n=1 Tax=uncultured Arsenicicoccus sp. TaxID=491339 RepID=UPI00259AE39A|nr:ABC transporter permease [uncultured Arsenicicoccus sp.]
MSSAKPRVSLSHKLLANQELLLLALIAAILVAVIVKVPDFLNVETLFNILRASMVNVVFALGVLLVLVAGGIDVSFLAIGIVAAYVACRVTPSEGPLAMALVPFLVAIGIGIVMGLVNAAVVISARVITLIATLATSAIFMGAMFAFGGGDIINTLPEPLQQLSITNLVTAKGAVRGTTRLNVLIVLVVVVTLLVWAFLRWTVAGRSIVALGGGEEAAARAAVPIKRIRTLVFALAGALAGLAGIIHVTLAERADPTTFMGQELNVIAAVVLGGAAITGGKGTVRGTVLGVVLISLIQTSLVPLGVPSIWQQAVVGLLLLLGVTLQALSARTRPARPILDNGPVAPLDPTTDPTPEGAR